MMMMRFMACQVSIKYYLLYPCFTPQPDSPTFQKLFCGIIIWIRDAGVEYATVWDSFTWPNYVHIAICVWLLHNFMEVQFNSILTRATVALFWKTWKTCFKITRATGHLFGRMNVPFNIFFLPIFCQSARIFSEKER